MNDSPDSRRKTSSRFYVCVGVLIVVAVGMNLVAEAVSGYFRKSALPIKKPLHLLDQSKLAPEYALFSIQPPPMDHEMIVNLGTEEYIQWRLVDRLKPPEDPASLSLLFVSYYTGGPGLVPHRPQECMAAAGMTQRSEEIVEIEVADAQGVTHVIPVCILEFIRPKQNLLVSGPALGGEVMTVAYFFYANGRYMTGRTDVRRAVSKMTDKYAYYSKIEMSFSNESFRELADKNETIEAVRRLLSKVMPILWEDHYQDWEAVKAGQPPEIN